MAHDVTHVHVTLEHDLHVKRCYTCGAYFAIEFWRSNGMSACPYCARDKIQELEQNLKKLVRSNISLKGVVTRTRRRKK